MTALLISLALWGAGDAVTKTRELGPVHVTTTLAPAEPKVGDEITLNIRVEAEADVDVLMPQFGEALSRYTILDFVPRRRVADDGSTVHSQRYTLQPYLSGDQSIPPILVEFVDNRVGHEPAPDDMDAYELLTERIDFHVESVLPAEGSDELNPPLPELEIGTQRGRASWLWWSVLAPLATLGLLAAGWYWRKRRQRVQRRSAYEIAKSRLENLLARELPQDEGAIEAFFVEITAIIRRYLEDRFDLRAPELTTEEFLAAAGKSGRLSAEQQSWLREFLRQADLVKFAGMRASEQEIRGSRELAVRFVESTGEDRPHTPHNDPPASSSSGGSNLGGGSAAGESTKSDPVREAADV